MTNPMFPKLENTTIHDYIFNECIGHGGFAAVYTVMSIRFGTQFVAKVILPTNSNTSSAWESFDSEVNALTKLDFPYIIRLYDHFSENGLFFLILEYCSQGSLYDEVMKRGPLTGLRLLVVAQQVISAVDYSHKNNVAHRDIKPQNILFDDFGRVKLADFGISVCMSPSELIISSKCSPSFAAPEVIRKDVHNVFSADIWSLGATLYFAATGRVPFKFRNVSQMLSDMKNVNLHLTQDMVPPAIFYLIKKMVVFDPIKRATIDECEQIIAASHPDKIMKAVSSLNRFPSLKKYDQDEIHFYSHIINTQNNVKISNQHSDSLADVSKPRFLSFKNISSSILKKRRSNEMRRVSISLKQPEK